MKIGAYVVQKQAKQNYKKESYNVRKWPGFEMILDVLRRNNIEYDYVGVSTAYQYDIILVSITSDCDWWPFIAERMEWKKSKTRVIVGGAGVLNIRPFLDIVNVFVFGRGDDLILSIIEAERGRSKVFSLSVCYTEDFSIDKLYESNQSGIYPHEITLADGKKYQEKTVGCPEKCIFCGYTWQRKYIGDGTFKAGADSMSKGNRERTIKELWQINPLEWQRDAPVRMVGLDGMSERLRKKVNKKITRAMWRDFLKGLARIEKPHQVKIYSIVGYPTETEDDWMECLEDIEMVDSELKEGKQWSLLFHFTPFRAMPATPAATWGMSYMNYRQRVSSRLKKISMKGNIFFQGNKFWAVEGMGTEGLSTVIESALIIRGVEADGLIIKKLAVSKKYWSSSMKDKIATLEKYVDVRRLFKKYSKQELPTRYLRPIRK